MTSKKNATNKAMSLRVIDGLTVEVIPNKSTEFLIPTNDVAKGYGVKASTLRQHKVNNPKEFIEGVHFLKSVHILDSPTKKHPDYIYWTKAGVIRLGFFIKSDRAKLFRDWAEKLILKVEERKDLFGNDVRAIEKPRSYNTLTRKNITSLLIDVCEIEDKELRMRIVNKLTNGGL